MGIGKIIKERRALLGINQQELADISGAGLRTIKQVETEKGNPSIKTLNKICAALGLELTLRIKDTTGL